MCRWGLLCCSRRGTDPRLQTPILPVHPTFRPPYRQAIQPSFANQHLFHAWHAPKSLQDSCELLRSVRAYKPSVNLPVLLIDC